MAKFTFKLDKPATGLAAVGNPLQSADIKLKRKVCGRIYAPTWSSKHRGYKAAFAVVNGDSFKWVMFSKETDTMNEMKEWLQSVTDEIIAKYDLYFIEY